MHRDDRDKCSRARTGTVRDESTGLRRIDQMARPGRGPPMPP